MIHKLALVVNDMNKLAAPMDPLEAKQVDLMVERGIPMPLVEVPVYDDAGNLIGKKYDVDLTNARASRRVRGKSGRGQGLPAPSGKAKSPLRERGIIEAHGTVSKSPLKQLKHRTVGPARRFLSGQNALGSKLKNRAALIGGAAALLGGAKLYSDSKDREQASKAVKSMSQPRQGMLPAQQMQYPSYQGKYITAAVLKQANPYVQNMANIPKPPTQPRVPSPGPSIGPPNIEGDAKGALGPKMSPSGTGTSSSSSGTKVAESDANSPLLAGGLGGLGGYALGKKVLSPMFEYHEKDMGNKIQAMKRMQQGLSTAKTNAPMAAAVAGAILLAAITAIKAREKQQQNVGGVIPRIQQHDPTNAGFAAHEENSFGYGPGAPGSFYG